MDDVVAFLGAALPWIAVGLLLAVLVTKGTKQKKKKEQTENYGTEGMCLGMCFGTAIDASFGDFTGIGTSLGMLMGLAIGTCVKKESGDEDKNVH
ncbi:MAG: hypothetical protein ACI39H_01725 [Lachnospiraceae bacterium]